MWVLCLLLQFGVGVGSNLGLGICWASVPTLALSKSVVSSHSSSLWLWFSSKKDKKEVWVEHAAGCGSRTYISPNFSWQAYHRDIAGVFLQVPFKAEFKQKPFLLFDYGCSIERQN